MIKALQQLFAQLHKKRKTYVMTNLHKVSLKNILSKSKLYGTSWAKA
jgi:hypothetical protein